MNRDIELLTDMFRDEENPFGTIIETGKEDHYYSSFGIHLLKEFENNDHYYHFLLSVVGKFQELDENQKERITNKMGIFPKTIIQKEITETKKKKTNKNTKPRINMKDDY